MALLQNTAEGGTLGAAVTTGNSGGASGNAWTLINNPTGSSLTYASGAARGSLCLDQSTHNSTGQSSVFRWDNTVTATGAAMRCLFKFDVLPGATTQFLRIANTSDAAYGTLALGADGRLSAIDAGAVTWWTSTGALQPNTWYRLELTLDRGASTTTGKTSVGYGTPTGPLVESIESTSRNTRTSSLTGRTQFGRISGTWYPAHLYWDDLAAQEGYGFIGPAEMPAEVHTTAGTATAVASTAASSASTRSASGTATAAAQATATSTSTRTSTGPAAAQALAAALSTSNRTSAGTAPATAAATGQHSTTRAATGTASSTATATAVTTQHQAEVHVTYGTAAAQATASATTSTRRTTSSTALARAVAYGATNTTRTGAGTTRAAAQATATTATLRAATATATARATGSAATSTQRASSGTAVAYAYATARTSQGGDLRDITITWGPLTTRRLTGTATGRTLTGTARARTLTGTLEV